jgi:transposase
VSTYFAKWTPVKQGAKDSSPRVVAKRRRFSKDFRRGLVQRTLVPGASVAKIALEQRLNANLLFKWRRRYLRELAALRGEAPKLLAVNVEPVSSASESRLLETLAVAPSRSAPAGCIEIELARGRIRLKGAVDPQTLRSVLQILTDR